MTQTEKVRATMKALTLDFALGGAGIDTWTRGMAKASGQLPEVIARIKEVQEAALAMEGLGAGVAAAAAGGLGAKAGNVHGEIAAGGSQFSGNRLMGVDQIWNNLQEGANRKDELKELKKQNVALQAIIDDGIKIKGGVAGVVGPN